MKKSTIYTIYIVGTSLLVYGLFVNDDSFITAGSTMVILSSICGLTET